MLYNCFLPLEFVIIDGLNLIKYPKVYRMSLYYKNNRLKSIQSSLILLSNQILLSPEIQNLKLILFYFLFPIHQI
jgi:hypothetical protein